MNFSEVELDMLVAETSGKPKSAAEKQCKCAAEQGHLDGDMPEGEHCQNNSHDGGGSKEEVLQPPEENVRIASVK